MTACLVGLAGVLYLAVGAPDHGPTEAGNPWAGTVEVAMLVAFGAVALRIAHHRTGWERTAWMWFSGAGFFVVVLMPLMVAPGWIPAQWGLAAQSLGLLVVYGFAFMGVMVLATGPERGRGASRILLDAAIIAGSFFFILWSAVFRDLDQGRPGAQAEVITALGYPIVDAALLTVAALGVARGAKGRPAGYGILVAALAVESMGDILCAAALPYNPALAGRFIDVFGWTAVLMMLVAALGVQRGRPWRPEARTRPSLNVELLPIAPLGLALLTAAEAWREHNALTPVQFWSACIVIALVMARLTVTVVTNRRLHLQVEANLESRTRLLHFISHELGNPLSPLAFQAMVLRQAGHDAQQRDKALGIIDRSLTRLRRLSDDVRGLALAETGQLVLKPSPGDLTTLAAKAVEASAADASARGVAVSLEPSPGIEHCPMDAERIAQTLDNLISNAVKFTPEGGHVRVRVRHDEGGARVEVADDGLGLDAKESAQLLGAFKRFHRDAAPGLGLGLNLCRAIVAGHGGRIGASSPGRGRGATFWFWLPGPAGPATASPRGAAAARAPSQA